MKLICELSAAGSKRYTLRGSLHREDGPAIEYYDGDKFWYNHGDLHREDGPAAEWSNGHKEWFYHGEKINCKDNEEFLRMIKLIVFL